MASSIPELAVYGHGRPAREGGKLQTQSEIIHSLNGSVGLQDGLGSKCANPSKRSLSQIILPLPTIPDFPKILAL